MSSSSSESSESSIAHSLTEDDDIVEEGGIEQVPASPYTAKSAEKQKWVTVQRKAFLHWINSYLSMEGIKIDDILDGFRNGVNLIIFLQLLTGETVTQGYTKKPKMRVHKITNCFIALKFLEELQVKGLTVSAEDIVDASEKNLKYILGFCWMLLRKFQNVPRRQKNDQPSDDEVESPFENRLLEWIDDMTEEYDLEVDGFSSLSNGRAIMALLEKYDKSIINFSEINWDNPLETITLALQLAEKHMGIPMDILDPQELIDGTVSEKNLVLYSTLMFNSFQNKLNNASKDSLLQQIKDLEVELKTARDALVEKKNVISEVVQTKKEEVKVEKEKLAATLTELEQYKQEKETEWETEKKDLLSRIEELKENFENLKVAATGETGELEKKNEETKQVITELTTLKEEMLAEREKLDAKNAKIESVFETARNDRQAMEDTVSKDQENVGAAIAKLSSHLTAHVENINVLKVFLKQKTTYTSETVQALTREEIGELNYEESLNSVHEKLEKENLMLMQLFQEQLLILQETRKTSQFNRGTKKRNIRAKSSKPPTLSSAEKKKERKKSAKASSSRRGEKSDKGDFTSSKEGKKRREERSERSEKSEVSSSKEKREKRREREERSERSEKSDVESSHSKREKRRRSRKIEKST